MHALRESNPATYERKVKAAQFKVRSVLHAGPRTTAHAS